MEKEKLFKLELEYQDYLKSIITGGELGDWMRGNEVDIFGDIDEMLIRIKKNHEGTTKEMIGMEASSFFLAARDFLLILSEWGKKGGIQTFKEFIDSRHK